MAAYTALIVSNPLKSNLHQAASCKFTIQNNLQIGILLMFAGSLFSFNRYKPS